MFQTDWLSVCVTHQPFDYNDPKDITQTPWYIYNNEFNESNKEVKIQKKEKKRIYVDSNSGPFGCKLCTKTT